MNDFVDQFIGLTSTLPFTRVDIAFQRPEAGLLTTFIDDFAVSPAAASPVPEPATLSLLGVGLAGAAVRRFRKRT